MFYVDPVIKNFLRTNQPENRGEYIRLDQNENPDGIPKWLFDLVMNKITPEFLSIYPEELKFKNKIASFLNLQPENITFTDGSVVAMGYVLKVFGQPGKKMICATPTFGMYKVYADMQGLETIFVHYNDDFTFDINNIINEIDNDTSIVSLVNPNMPVGNIYNRDEIEAVVKKAQEFNAIVVIDEAYYYFYNQTALDLIKKYENVIILRTFSKMFSIPALRIGVILSTKENIQYINNYKPHYTVNSVALAFGEAIIDNHDKLIDELSEKFFKGKNYLIDALEKENYKYVPTHGCFICIYPKHKSAEEITEELKNKGLLIFCGKGDSAGLLRVTIWDVKYMKIFMQYLLEVDN